VNLCNSSQTTAASAKVDYVFGEEVRGLGSTGGMGVAWESQRPLLGRKAVVPMSRTNVSL